MKPYRETHTFEGVLDAPVERAWALHTNPDEMCSVFSRILQTEVVAGRPGEVGCLTRSIMQTLKGRIGTVESEIVDCLPPHALTVRTMVLEASRINQESTRTFERRGNHTHTTLSISAETVPLLWPAHLVLRLGRARRGRQTAAEFEAETAEENAYYARSEGIR
jgi:uncharacterized protein YndB with AHSA1/START domain